MKKVYLLLFMSFIFTLHANSQTLVASTGFDNYAGSLATVPAGWYCSWNTASSFYTSTGNYGLAAPSYKFGNDSDFVVAPKVIAGIDKVTFFARGNGVPFSTANELQLFQSVDSINWTLVASVDSLPLSGTTITVNLNGSPYLKFLYRKQPAGGNLAFDDVMIYSNATSVNNISLPENSSVYPSPSTGTVYVNVGGTSSEYKIEVFDLLGNLVKDVMVEKISSSVYSLNLASQRKGLYFIKMQSATSSFTKRITLVD